MFLLCYQIQRLCCNHMTYPFWVILDSQHSSLSDIFNCFRLRSKHSNCLQFGLSLFYCTIYSVCFPLACLKSECTCNPSYNAQRSLSSRQLLPELQKNNPLGHCSACVTFRYFQKPLNVAWDLADLSYRQDSCHRNIHSSPITLDFCF